MTKKGSSSNVRLSSKVIYAKDNHFFRLNEKVSRVFFAQRHTRKIYGLLRNFFSSYIRACPKRKMKLNYIDLSAYYKDCKTISGRTETLTRDSRRDAINIVITSFTADSTSTGEKNLSLKKYIQKNVDEKERW